MRNGGNMKLVHHALTCYIGATSSINNEYASFIYD